MSDEIEKPRKVRDIRERLGRITTNPGAPGDETGDVVPPPPGVGGVAPPPRFVGGRVAKRSGPFSDSATGGAPQQEVRIVVDEKAVASAKEGTTRKARRFMLIAGGAAGALGLLLGVLAGGVTMQRRAYNQAVRDGKEIYQTVRTASDEVAEAKMLLDQVVAAARARPGIEPKVDYQAIEKLRSLPTPFSAAEFTGRRYDKFSPETVNALFAYTRNVSALWEGFDKLGSSTLPNARRRELNEAAKDQNAVVATPTGCVPTLGEGGFRCGLVYVDMPEEGASSGKKLRVRTSRGSRAFEKELYIGQDLQRNPSNYVILTNPEQSQGVLGRRQNAFARYRKELAALSALMGSTLESQGLLEKGLGQVAGLQELSTL